LLQELVDYLELVEGKVLGLEEEIAKRVHPFDDAVHRLRQIPGVDRITAWGLIAEIGVSACSTPMCPAVKASE
jgi:transposase